MSQNHILVLFVMVVLLLACARPSGGSALPCISCEIDDDMLLEKSWVCGECGTMYSSKIEHCCFCDKSFYGKCLEATGLQNKDTDLHGKRISAFKRFQ